MHLGIARDDALAGCRQQDNAKGVFLKEYVDAMVETAALNHIRCLDLWRTLGLNSNNYKSFTFDGTHPKRGQGHQKGRGDRVFYEFGFLSRARGFQTTF